MLALKSVSLLEHVQLTGYFPAIIDGQDDGKVSVERTKLVGMTDHLVMPVTHPMMMRNKRVIEQTKAFLKDGEFLR